LTSLAV